MEAEVTNGIRVRYNCGAIRDGRWKRETVGSEWKMGEDGLRFGWIEMERAMIESLI